MLFALLVSASLVFTGQDADFAYACASNFVSRNPARDAGTICGHLAANWILDTASMTGVNVRRDEFRALARTSEGHAVERSFVNLYATFKPKSGSPLPWIVLVSHYDTKPGKNCPGANDGASTSGLLIALAAALERCGYGGRANVMLAWLDGEECVSSYSENDGFWGSRHAAELFQRREMNVKAVICLDMLGDRNLKIMMPANGTPTLMKVVKKAAMASGTEVTFIGKSVRDDHVAFLEAGYPSVDLIDFDYGSISGKNDWWHTPHDTLDKISRDSLLKSGRLAVEVINILAQ